MTSISDASARALREREDPLPSCFRQVPEKPQYHRPEDSPVMRFKERHLEKFLNSSVKSLIRSERV